MEAIVAAEPDLVVVSSSGADSVADHYAEISARFPTVVVDYSKQDWRKLSVQLGEATGLESKAKKVTADFDQYVRDAKAKIKPPDGDVSIVSFNGAGGQNQAVGKREGPHAKLLEAMGFTVVDAPPGLETRRQKRSDFAFVTYENLAKAIKGKSIFLISASDKTVAGFLADPLLANLPAVQSKRVHSLGLLLGQADRRRRGQVVQLTRRPPHEFPARRRAGTSARGSRRRLVALAALCLALAALCAVGMVVGSRIVPLHETWNALWHYSPKDGDHVLIRQVRIPRTAIAVAAGSCLGLAGALTQSLTRNALAEPGTLGVNHGLSLIHI